MMRQIYERSETRKKMGEKNGILAKKAKKRMFKIRKKKDRKEMHIQEKYEGKKNETI